jgi:hypothetical protein
VPSTAPTRRPDALSAVGGFLALPPFLEPLLPLPEVPPELAAFETPLVFVSVALAFVLGEHTKCRMAALRANRSRIAQPLSVHRSKVVRCRLQNP